MGLNYVKRGKRETLDPPNDFISVSLGQTDPEFSHYDEQIIYDFENTVLDRVQKRIDDIEF